MTETLSESEVPNFPMPRAEGCPFDPPPLLRELQSETRFAQVRLPTGATAWVVTRYADQRALLADPRVSADPATPGYPMHMRMQGRRRVGFILMDDPEHRRLRQMVAAPFTIKRVAAMRPMVRRIVDDLIDTMLAGPKPADLVTAFALPVPSLVICELLGVPYGDHDLFQRNSSTLIRRSATPEERMAAGENLTRYLEELLAEKERNPAEDLLSDLVGRVEAGEITRPEAAQMGVLLLIAGHETTANMIALGTLTLLEHPDQLGLLRDADDPEVVKAAVEELLRYLNITHSGRRRVATEDIEIDGHVIRAGDGLIMANDIANRDEQVFTDPDRLDLERDARRHVAFGFGVHQCLGQPLARMELEVVYGTLYRRVPTLRRAVPLEEIPFKHDGSVYGVYELPVTW